MSSVPFSSFIKLTKCNIFRIKLVSLQRYEVDVPICQYQIVLGELFLGEFKGIILRFIVVCLLMLLYLSIPGSVSDMSLTSESNMFCEPLEETLCAQVVETIAQKLTDPSDNVLRCSKIILPDLLLQNIRQKLLHLASTEPCGLRGALIDLCLAQGDQKSLCSVDRLAVEPSLVPTFHLTLVLRPDAGGLWPKFQKLFRGIYSPPKHRMTMNQRHSLRLSTSFMAIKRKLYSSEELLVEEC